MSIFQKIESQLREAIAAAAFDVPDAVQVSEAPSHVPAELSTNVALQIAQKAGKNPREVAVALSEELQKLSTVESVEIAGPGFLNIILTPELYTESAAQSENVLDRIKLSPELHKKINVEYVSANPSGPVHIGNARGGPVGEIICRILEAQGHTVAREFYVNDIGGQANRFAESVLHFYKLHFGVESVFPEKGYPAPYIQELANEIVEALGDRLLQAADPVEAMRKEAIERQVAKIKVTIDRMGITFDRWYNQSNLVDSGLSAETFEDLKSRGATFEKDGAVWLKSGISEDDRETVLKKSNGITTYFLDDIAYHKEKFGTRGFDVAVVALGANHSGHIPRMQAGVTAIGYQAEQYQAVLYQYVQLKEDGETRRMAKREGTFVTADEVLDEIPLDVFNWFMLSKTNETHLDFDMKLAKDTSEKNPVYYVQYAHARIHSIIAKESPAEAGDYVFNDEEKALLRHLDRFAEVVDDVATNYRVHALPNYLYELATRYHHFYAQHRVITDDSSVTYARLGLSRLAAATLKAGLGLMNISAPEHM